MQSEVNNWRATAQRHKPLCFQNTRPGDPRVNIQNDNGNAKAYLIWPALTGTMDANKYCYRIIWSEEDEGFVGLCAEFPGLSWLADNQPDALRGIVDLVKDSLADMEQNGEKIPEPISLRNYSGHFFVRTTPDIHRKLVMLASEAGVGLNRYVNSLVAGVE